MIEEVQAYSNGNAATLIQIAVSIDLGFRLGKTVVHKRVT